MQKLIKDINQALIDSTKKAPKYPKGTKDAPSGGEFYECKPKCKHDWFYSPVSPTKYCPKCHVIKAHYPKKK